MKFIKSFYWEGEKIQSFIKLTIIISSFIFGALPAFSQPDKEAGAKVFRFCKSCHSIGEKAKNRTGPHLNDLFGRPVGSIEGFNYSKDMRRVAASGLKWDNEHIDMFIENPKSLVFKTKMAFRGIKDPDDRANLIAFLRQFSANPADIPEAEPTLAATDPDIHPSILAINGDPEYGEYLSGECITCHQIEGKDEGIPSIIGWNADDFVIALHAYKNGHRSHQVMQMIAKRLSDEEIAGLAAYFATQ